ncbi:MAG: NAD(P)H-hydrate epimerase [Candidatus Omnitrophica bacterium]|nr:NAD(P)H-hydrate epimerase [Candidatus Omnitrophota bacterium]
MVMLPATRRKANFCALSAAQMQALDRWAIETVGLPALCLMESAGRAVADEACRMLRRRGRRETAARVCIVCGNGNNGADGLVAARYLWDRGVQVRVICAGEPSRASAECSVHQQVSRKLGIPLKGPDPRGLFMPGGTDLLVDALFGVGLSRPLQGAFLALVEAVNASGVPVLAVDVPSGLDATTGRVAGACVKADVTVTMACPKTGLFAGAGPRYAGRIVVADIGMPRPRGRRAAATSGG